MEGGVEIALATKSSVDVPGQWGWSITMAAAISDNDVRMCIQIIGPYSPERLVPFLDPVYEDLNPEYPQYHQPLGYKP